MCCWMLPLKSLFEGVSIQMGMCLLYWQIEQILVNVIGTPRGYDVRLEDKVRKLCTCDGALDILKIWEVGLPTKSWILIKVVFLGGPRWGIALEWVCKCINMSKSGEVSPNWWTNTIPFFEKNGWMSFPL